MFQGRLDKELGGGTTTDGGDDNKNVHVQRPGMEREIPRGGQGKGRTPQRSPWMHCKRSGGEEDPPTNALHQVWRTRLHMTSHRLVKLAGLQGCGGSRKSRFVMW